MFLEVTRRSASILALAFLTAACGASDTPAGTTADEVPTTASIPLDGDPNGLFWDDASGTLYVADDGNNRILTYRDGEGTRKLADLPAAPADGPGLGQLVKLGDGSVLVTRFGFGSTGDVVHVETDGSSSVVPGLDREKRRIGLTVAPDGTVYDGYFVRKGAEQVGSIARLTLDGTETDVVTGLGKVVGVLAAGDSLFVSDQAKSKLFKSPLSDVASLAAVADLPNADLLCEGPSGTIFSGGSDGNVRAIDASGAVSVVATGFVAVRGVAYDAGHRRLFIANHAGEPGQNTLEIRPVR